MRSLRHLQISHSNTLPRTVTPSKPNTPRPLIHPSLQSLRKQQSRAKRGRRKAGKGSQELPSMHQHMLVLMSLTPKGFLLRIMPSKTHDSHCNMIFGKEFCRVPTAGHSPEWCNTFSISSSTSWGADAKKNRQCHHLQREDHAQHVLQPRGVPSLHRPLTF